MLTKTRYEQLAQRLTDRGVEFFYPKELRIVHSRMGGHLRTVPIMTPYFFIRAPYQQVRLLKSEEDNLAFVVSSCSQNHSTLKVPDKQMEDFIRVCEAHHEDTMVHRLDEVELLKGTRVRVSGGQLDGVEGVVAKVKGFRSKRLIITVQNVLTVSAPVNNQTFIKLLPNL